MRFYAITALILMLLVQPTSTWAIKSTPAQAAETLRTTLVQAQMQVAHDQAAAQASVQSARTQYDATLATAIQAVAPTQATQINTAWVTAEQALKAGDAPGFATARAEIWTTILASSYSIVAHALLSQDYTTAQAWLPVREFRSATRFSRPTADAALAIDSVAAGTMSPTDALLAVKADMFDTYQARLVETLRVLRNAATKDYATQRAEAGGLARGYFAILAPAYREQRGDAANLTALTTFDQLAQSARSGDNVPAALTAAEAVLQGFRAAPLNTAEQVRRAGQLLRFLTLVSVEYGRGVKDGVVTRDLEIQEATTFRNGAMAAFIDLESLLSVRDPIKTERIAAQLRDLETKLMGASDHSNVPSPEVVQQTTATIIGLLQEVMPAEWQKTSINGDFDVVAAQLDEMEKAAAAGEYDLAESARLEAYAVLEAGPEARLVVFAPQYKAPIEGLFWYGQGDVKGLARLIGQNASLREIKASRDALDEQLGLAQKALGSSNAPMAVASNAAIIVFREGLEAVLILASLLASFKAGEIRKLRRPIWIGAVGALLASVLTWILAQGILQSLARYGEKLEAVVSLIAIGVLLLITNWFFHKVYWTGWMANFHARKRRIVGGAAGLWLGLIMLGFTSIYREGFETVLFLQALVLESGPGVVLSGVAMGLLGTLGIGIMVFLLQAKLPHKKMLIATGILIGIVLVQMVGNTVYVMQIVGWLPLHPIRTLTLPYWAGLWFGVYTSWEGIAFQVASAAFVIGSYFLAEYFQHRRTAVAIKQQAAT